MAYPKRTIYLAGPISGLSYEIARHGWRTDLRLMLDDMGLDHISCSSPMRGKEFLKGSGLLVDSAQAFNYPEEAMATAAGITTRDYNDVRMCDAMVACYTESEGRPSLGTAAEFGYCWALHKPVITIGPADEINVRHLMLERMTGYRVDTLEEAALIVGHLLTPGI